MRRSQIRRLEQQVAPSRESPVCVWVPSRGVFEIDGERVTKAEIERRKAERNVGGAIYWIRGEDA